MKFCTDSVEVRVCQEDRVLSGEAFSLGNRGMQLLVEEPLQESTLTIYLLHRDGTLLQLHGLVNWLQPLTADGKTVVGVLFKAGQYRQRRVIEKWLRANLERAA